MNPRSAYLHVPFCRHRCGYCNFTLVAGRDDLIDTYLDARSGYYFEMNPRGAMGDTLLLSTSATGGGDSARAWDGIWTGKVQKSQMGWTIEIEIPFRTM